MSDFEPSPRSAKRRKVTRSSSTKANISSPSHQSVSRSGRIITRRLFDSRESDDELANEGQAPNINDSTYGSKEDSFLEEPAPKAVHSQLAQDQFGAGDSADELALPRGVATPSKSQKSNSRPKVKTPRTAEQAKEQLAGDEESEHAQAQTRSSGRQRKPPRRFSSSRDDQPRKAVPKDISTPGTKRNQTTLDIVTVDQDRAAVEDGLGFKDVSQSTKRKTKEVKRSKKTHPGGEILTQADGDARNRQDVIQEEDGPLEETLVEGKPLPYVPELPVIASKTPEDAALPTANADLNAAKSIVLSRLTGRTRAPLINLESEYNKLHSLLLATIKSGEGNSILLLGSRGVGKTCLIETALANLASEHSEDFHVVRLNGFIQTDDKLALREIWRQLGREMQVEEDETAQVSSYADTMASLLHLLSHPEELAETLDADGPARTAKSVVFVLDEFDLFTTHPRQTLLYNLFDIAQARKAPIAVVGCTARVDVSDHLEKRVKSRFSHRWIHLSQAKSLSAFEEIAKSALSLSEHDRCQDSSQLPKQVRNDWNTLIEKAFLCSDHVQSLLKLVFYTTKSVPELLSSLYIDVVSIASLGQFTPSKTILPRLQAPDSVLDLLPRLPSLHLSLLISTARLDAIHNATVVTFPLVYSHYTDLVARARLQASAAGSIAQATKLWGRDVAAAAWEELAEWEIVLPAAGKGTERGETKMWKCDVVLEEIEGAAGGGVDEGMSDMMIRWCKEV